MTNDKQAYETETGSKTDEILVKDATPWTTKDASKVLKEKVLNIITGQTTGEKKKTKSLNMLENPIITGKLKGKKNGGRLHEK